jgi:hypothetical protein
MVDGSSAPVASQSCADSGGSGENAFSIPHRCQVIYGVVPQVATTDDLLRNLIAPESCNISEVADQYARPRHPARPGRRVRTGRSAQIP